MSPKQLLAVVFAAALLVSASAPVMGASGETSSGVAFDVAQHDTEPVAVTVTDNGTAVSNATLEVSTGPNETYAGTGEYTTDGDGTVSLPVPDERVNVTMSLVDGNDTLATTTATLVPVAVDVTAAEDGSGTVHVTRGDADAVNASVVVTADGNYTDAGTHATDENGTVALSAPNETTTLTVDVVRDNATLATTTATLSTVDVSVSQDAPGETATVRVTDDDTALDNATVVVEADGNYTGEGTYTTDENGTVTLYAPAETVNVTASVVADDVTLDSATATLEPRPSLDMSIEDADGDVLVTVTRDGEPVSNATVEVTSEDTYGGTGTYATDDEGTVTLPEPATNVTVTITATDDGQNATATVDLTVQNQPKNFGQRVARFIQNLKGGDAEGGIGVHVSEFATENNPGHSAAADRPHGPPEHADDEHADDEHADDEHADDEHADDEHATETPEDGNETATGADTAGPAAHGASDAADHGDDDHEDDGHGDADDADHGQANGHGDADDADDGGSSAEEQGGGPPEHANGNAKGHGK